LPQTAGAWRVEVSPKAQRAADVFVHVIRVGDKTLKDAGTVEAVENADLGRAGVRIKTAHGETSVTFNVVGPAGGHIALTGAQKIDQDLSREIQPQSGLGSSK
jgi:hypothetical protein